MNNNKIVIVCNCSTDLHLYYFLPSYLKSIPGSNHDLIIIHNNFNYINKNNFINITGKVIFYNKILENGKEIPNRGTGSYKHIFEIYKNDYDIFCFLYEHTSIRRNNWIHDAIKILNYNDIIGFCASQIFNGNDLAENFKTKYPHETHIRSPGPIFIKTKYLKEIKWNIKNDHHGEMILGKELSEICIGIQIGNKINYAYDNVGSPPLIDHERAKKRHAYNHITSMLEKKYFPNKKGCLFYEPNEYSYFENLIDDLNIEEIENSNIIHTMDHIGKQNIFYDIQPFNNLIYGNSVNLAFKNLNNNNIKKILNFYVLIM